MIDRKTRDALRGTVKRIETHPATPGSLDSRGRDWNDDTMILTMESGERIEITSNCYSGLQVELLK